MVYIKKGTSTMKQTAYARRVFSADGVNKKQIALDVGYSPNLSNSIVSHIESTAGFQNAISKLACESNNIALSAIAEFKARGFEDFTNKEMISALTAIAGAWEKFSAPARDVEKSNNTSTNKLRTVILQQIENQTVLSSDKPMQVQSETMQNSPKQSETVRNSPKQEEIDLDF
jgi:hypothetical protein